MSMPPGTVRSSLATSPQITLTLGASRPSQGALVEDLVARGAARASPRSRSVTCGVGQLSQDLAEHGLPQEPGGTGEQERLAGEKSLQREGFVGQTATVPPSLLTCQ